MDATKIITIKGTGRNVSITTRITPPNTPPSPVTIFAASMSVDLITSPLNPPSTPRSPTPAPEYDEVATIVKSTLFAIAVHPAGENEAPNTKHVQVTAGGNSSVKWCGGMHWVMMAAVKAQSATEKQTKLILNGMMPRTPKGRAPIYATVKTEKQVEVELVFKDDQVMGGTIEGMKIEAADLPGRSKPNVRVNGGRTTMCINKINPPLITMASFAFHDTFREATEREIEAYEAKAPRSLPQNTLAR
jgi:hypothetical protein